MSMQTMNADDESNSTISEVPSAELISDGIQEGAYTIPDSLLDREIWLCYKIEEDGRKVPKQSRVDGHVRNIDPTKDEGGAGLTTYYEALGAIKKSKARCEGDFSKALDGVGLTLGEMVDGRQLAGFDVDDAIDEDGNVCEYAVELVEELDTYAELSPSGTGIHALFFGELDADYKNRTDIPGDTESHLEVYDGSGGRFFTYSGRALESAPDDVNHRGETAREIQRAWFDKRDDTSTAIVDKTGTEPNPGGLTESDARVLSHIRQIYSDSDKFDNLWNGRISSYESHSEADLALCRILSYSARKNGQTDTAAVDRLFRASGLMREKWAQRDDYRRVTLETAHFSSFE